MDTGSCSINPWAHLIEFQLPWLCPDEILWSLEYFLFNTEDSSRCSQAGKENHGSGGILLIRFVALLQPCGIFKPQLMENNVINTDFLDILHKCHFYLPFLHWVLNANFIHFLKKSWNISVSAAFWADPECGVYGKGRKWGSASTSKVS